MRPFKFLVVEDDLHTLEWLVRVLKTVFPDAVVHTAANVADAFALLQQARAEGQEYDAALLDFRLPKADGEEHVYDFTLCDEIARAHRGTLVLHMTGHMEDERVVTHLAVSHGEPSKPWPLFFSKSDVDWPMLLVKRLKAHLYGQEITTQLDELFGLHLAVGGGPTRAAAFRRPLAREGAVTQRLASVMQNIEDYWPDLSDALRERIAANFVVDPGPGDKVRVGLL